jgi:hypothetical protein
MRIFPLLLFLALLVPSPTRAQPSLVVEPLSGKAPHLVRIAGPTLVLTKIAECRFGWFEWTGPGGNGVLVDWGDGTETFSLKELYTGDRRGESCAERQRRHVYAIPGTYRVKVEIWHPGPIDAPVTDWSGEAVVTVGGKSPPDSLEIIEPHDQQVFPYHLFPHVRWRASVSEPSTIRVEMLSESGAQLGAKDFDWASVGERDAQTPFGFEEYDAALRRGETSAFLRVSLMRAGKVLISRDSLPQGISGLIRDNYFFVLVPRCPDDEPYTISVKVNLPLSDGELVRIEWGDGETMEYFGRQDERESVFAHTYSQPGYYNIKLSTDAYSGDQNIDDVVSYYMLGVRVPVLRVDRFPDTRQSGRCP